MKFSLQINNLEKKISKENKAEMLPRFEFLRSDNDETHDKVGERNKNNHHKISVPFKRLNKRLTDILSEIQDRNDEVKAEIADFRLIFSDQSHEQTALLQDFRKNFASIEQVCGEQSRDFSRQVKSCPDDTQNLVVDSPLWPAPYWRDWTTGR